LTDDLPAGLDYQGFTVITDVAQSGGLLTQDFAGTGPSITVTGGAGSGDDVTLTFSIDVVVTGDNNAANNRFLVVVRVRALDEPGMVQLISLGRDHPDEHRSDALHRWLEHHANVHRYRNGARRRTATDDHQEYRSGCCKCG
jgi:hypothetical protein